MAGDTTEFAKLFETSKTEIKQIIREEISTLYLLAKLKGQNNKIEKLDNEFKKLKDIVYKQQKQI